MHQSLVENLVKKIKLTKNMMLVCVTIFINQLQKMEIHRKAFFLHFPLDPKVVLKFHNFFHPNFHLKLL